jgi:hypothetical protein
VGHSIGLSRVGRAEHPQESSAHLQVGVEARVETGIRVDRQKPVASENRQRKSGSTSGGRLDGVGHIAERRPAFVVVDVVNP